jgi:hypothetical protein
MLAKHQDRLASATDKSVRSLALRIGGTSMARPTKGGATSLKRVRACRFIPGPPDDRWECYDSQSPTPGAECSVMGQWFTNAAPQSVQY